MSYYFNDTATTEIYTLSLHDALPISERPLLDRWALATLAEVTEGVTAALEDFDTQGAGRLLAQFVDDLSNWYVRRSRRRFWDGDPAALGTLHEVLDGLTRLLAPFTPFVTDEVWSRADRKSTRLNSSHANISYAVFCLKKKNDY